MKVYSADTARAIDAAVIASGVSGESLMGAAGLAIANGMTSDTSLRRVSQFIILCGKGNNAGDGFQFACCRGGRIYAPQPKDAYTGDARIFADRLPSEVEFIVKEELTPDDFPPDCIIIDALLGTGYKAPLRPWIRQWIQTANASGAPIAAVDIPSGLDADTGEIDGDAIRADMTYTVIVPKAGLFLGQGPEYAGRIRVADIIPYPAALPATLPPIADPHRIIERFPAIEGFTVFTEADARPFLSRRSYYTYKGTAGRILCIGGSRHYAGATGLCSEAALRAGGGMVVLVTAEDAKPNVPNAVMVRRIPNDKQGFMTLNVNPIADLATWPDVAVIGPGLGRTPDAQGWVRYLFADYIKTRKIVADADALTAIAEMGAVPLGYDLILTPHLGEAERLAKGFGVTAPSPGNDPKLRMDYARALAEKTRAVIVLKGPNTIVAAPDGRLSINTSGNDALATAGTGDVLSGIIGGFFASGMSAFDAACLGVFVHGYTADYIVSRHFARRSLIADDLLAHLPAALSELSPFA